LANLGLQQELLAALSSHRCCYPLSFVIAWRHCRLMLSCIVARRRISSCIVIIHRRRVSSLRDVRVVVTCCVVDLHQHRTSSCVLARPWRCALSSSSDKAEHCFL